jgi:hypothetical protein
MHKGADGIVLLYNGVTRATRIAKLTPGTLIRVEVIGKLPDLSPRRPRSET